MDFELPSEPEAAELRSVRSLEELDRQVRRSHGGRLPLREWVAIVEAWRIQEALREAGGNRSAAARALGIGRRTLYTKMEKLGIGMVPQDVVDS